MTTLEIRAARPGDARALGRMGATLARFHQRLDRRRFFASRDMDDGYADWLAKELASPEAVVLAAVERAAGRERLVGYAYGRLEGRDWNTLRGPAGVAVDLWVAPRARRRGAARRLVAALVAALAARGAPQVVLHVAARNRRALAAFEGMGFRRTMIELAAEPGEAGLRPPAPARPT
jgi:ribosomal protein S18 acetylase RimI-like enzyme